MIPLLNIMSNKTQDNKRIAKNTIILYFRMVLMMLVSLYTSRVVLQVLGVRDFGIYNLVGGIVVMIAFLSNALNASCSRFLCIAIGKNDVKEIQRYFSSALLVHAVFCLLLLLFLEFVGIWLITYFVNIPEGRESATLWVYQFAIFSTISTVIRTPFNASIIAHERMGFFAWSSIAEGLMKLAVVFCLPIISYDSLIVFAFLTAFVSFLVTLLYLFYTQISFKGHKLLHRSDRCSIRSILSFGFWNIFVGAADIGWQQGTNIILNLFHGVSLNAAMGITNQVRTAMYSLVSNLQTAANPQIIKSYSQNDRSRYCTLFFSISKYSFLLMCFFAIPLMLNINYVLELWLGSDNIPLHTPEFVLLIILFSLIDNLVGPLWTINQAQGDIKIYSIIVSIILLLNLPVTYVLFYAGMSPSSMLIARIIILLLSLSFQIYYTQLKIGIHIKNYILEVAIPILCVSVLTATPTYAMCNNVSGGKQLLLSLTIFIPLYIASVLLIGMKKEERTFLINYINKRLKK